MPKINNKKFPYTKKGKAQAKEMKKHMVKKNMRTERMKHMAEMAEKAWVL